MTLPAVNMHQHKWVYLHPLHLLEFAVSPHPLFICRFCWDYETLPSASPIFFFPAYSQRLKIVGSLCDWEVACAASDRQGLNF